MKTNITTFNKSGFSLRLNSFGSNWLLEPVIEPIWDIEGHLKSVELLSRIKNCTHGHSHSPSEFFNSLAQSELCSVLAWQLELLAIIRPWCDARGVPVSLNLNRAQAFGLISSPYISGLATNLAPWLRIEISEDFVHLGSNGSYDAVLDSLKSVSPLWLDDFGAGSTGLNWLSDGFFEAVKLDRNLFGMLCSLHEGVRFMSALSVLASSVGVKIVAEGVCDDSRMAAARDAGVHACQGFLWPAVPFRKINSLPSTLSSSNAGDA